MKAVCAQVGPVVKFSICYHPETGQSKGYGFCEYNDPKLVGFAIDLLHGFEHGGKKLYVRRANQEIDELNKSKKKEVDGKKKKKHTQTSKNQQMPMDQVMRVLSSMSTLEKKEILNEMKALIERDEESAKDVLLENPQLCQALLLVFMDFNWLSIKDVGHLTKLMSNGEKDTMNGHGDGDDDGSDVEMKTMETVNNNGMYKHEDKENMDMDQDELPGIQRPVQPRSGYSNGLNDHSNGTNGHSNGSVTDGHLNVHPIQQPVQSMNGHSNYTNGHSNDVITNAHLHGSNGHSNGTVTNVTSNGTNGKPHNGSSPNPLSKLPAEHQTVLNRILKMSAAELAKLPVDQQKQINVIKAKLAKRNAQ